MSSEMRFPRAFVEDWKLYEQWLLETGDTPEGVAEIKQAIKDSYEDKERLELWFNYVKARADFMRSLHAQAADINERIRSREPA